MKNKRVKFIKKIGKNCLIFNYNNEQEVFYGKVDMKEWNRTQGVYYKKAKRAMLRNIRNNKAEQNK